MYMVKTATTEAETISDKSGSRYPSTTLFPILGDCIINVRNKFSPPLIRDIFEFKGFYFICISIPHSTSETFF